MIIVTGSLAFDHIMDFPGKFSDHIMPEKIHMLNVSFLVPQMRKSYGGTAGNIAYTLALLGARATIFAVVGKDFAPYKEFLEKNGVDTSNLFSTNDHYTSTAFAITDQSDNQIWGFYPGADSISDTLSLKTVKNRGNGREKSFGIVAPQNPKAMMTFAKEYTDSGIPYLFDPGMQLRWLKKDDLEMACKSAHVIIGNDYEVAMMEKITGRHDFHETVGSKRIVITTLGEKGSRITCQGKRYDIPAVPVDNPSDPTGAGDAYRAGFVAGFIKNMPGEVCGRMGATAAAFAVEVYGTMNHRFSLQTFEKRYKAAFNETFPHKIRRGAENP